MADPALAEDLAMEAIERSLDLDGHELGQEEDRFRRLCAAMNGLVINAVRKRRRRRTDSLDALDPQATHGDPERAVIDSQELAMLSSRVSSRFAGDKVVLQLYHSFLAGIDKPRDQAIAMGVPIEELRTGIRRLRSFCKHSDHSGAADGRA